MQNKMLEIMDTMDIAFPNLGIYLENVPSSFTVFGFELYLYGVVIGLGAVLGILMAEWASKVNGMNPDDVWDFAFIAIPCSIIGARLYYVVFEWDSFKGNPLSIFDVREGGLAIYGAVIVAFLTLFLYCKKRKWNPFRLGDCGVQGLILGQILGRWGNFFNREVFGGYTNNLLAMRIPVDAVRDPSDITEGIKAHMVEGTNYIQVHPTFLYESLLNLVLLVFMIWWHRRKKFNGEICLLYLGGYGIIRFFVEGIRTDQLKIPGTDIAVSQMLGIGLFLVALVAEIIVRYRIKKGK